MDHMLFTAQGAQFHAVVVVPFPGDQASPGPVAALLAPGGTGGTGGHLDPYRRSNQKGGKSRKIHHFYWVFHDLFHFLWVFLWVFYGSLVCVFHGVPLKHVVFSLPGWRFSTSHLVIPTWQCARPQSAAATSAKTGHPSPPRPACRPRSPVERLAPREPPGSLQPGHFFSWVKKTGVMSVHRNKWLCWGTSIFWTNLVEWSILNFLGKTKHMVEVTARISQTKSFLLNRTPPQPS